jgi:riboflavin synthase
MFTGIVEELGIVRSVSIRGLEISARRVVEGTVAGDSICVNGACLTAIEVGGDRFAVDVMPETFRRTNLGSLRPGDRVNLERAMAAGGRFGGHFVQGHVDGGGRIVSLAPEQEAVLMTVAAPPELGRYFVEKGFVAVDGVSLTIARCDSGTFTVSLVGFTRDNTTLGQKRSGDMVNIEVDIMAKYAERLKGGESSGITLEFLDKHGFLAA